MPQLPAWNAADYAANSAVQLAWARELMASLPWQGEEHTLDVGCGDGKITAELAGLAPRGSATGIDVSLAMITHARAQFPQVEFHVVGGRRITFARQFDLVFSNAALHWVDNHAAFLHGAAAVLRPGGRLVVSCGGAGNGQGMVRVMQTIMRQPRWRGYFRELPRPYFFYTPAEYAPWLAQAGLRAERVACVPRDAVYAGHDGLTAWLRTAWLPYTQRVPETERPAFIKAAADRYLAEHPVDSGGQAHVAMVRLEISAMKIGGIDQADAKTV